MDVNKYRSLFIAESREHLEATAQLLVEVENVADAARATELVDEIFRHVHSVKGMAASMGYEPIATLAHRMEDVVGEQRAGRPARETTDLLLSAVDALTAQVECIARELPLDEYLDLVKALRATSADAAPEAPPPTVVPEPSPPPETGKELVVRLDETTAAPQVRAFLVYRRLSEVTEIVGSQPSLAQIKAGNLTGFELRFQVAATADLTECERRLAALADVEEVWAEAVQPPPSSEAEPEPEPTAKPEPKPTKEMAEAHAADPVTLTSSGGGPATVRVRTDVLDDLIDSVGELFIVRERLLSLLGDAVRPEVSAALDNLTTRIREIHGQVMAVRMVPLRTVTDRYPRIVRDLSRSLDKDVAFEVEGGEIELDRAILDNLETPFVHAIRNAIDHGIESPAERLERGKAASGTIVISATRDRDTVLVEIADDGRGLDPLRLRSQAVEKGLIAADQAEGMSARESFFLICTPGFSTKGVVSDVSGRGVGMDAVRAIIEGLGGSLDIDSELGRGTRVVFRLPLTLAIIPVLLVEAAGRTFALPAAKVVAVREPGNDVFEQAGGNVYFSFQHALVLINPLGRLLGMQRYGRIANVVVLEDGRDLYALAVDRIVGYQEVVVKPLGDPLDRLIWFSGATVLGDGNPILILDVPKALRVRAAA